MAQGQDSVIEDLEQSEILSGCKVMSFEVSDAHNDANSLCDSVIRSTDNMHSVELSLTDDCQSTEFMEDKSSEIEVKSSANALVESQYRHSHAVLGCHRDTSYAQWHSTPAAAQCSSNSSAMGCSVSDRQMQDCECDQKSVSHVGTKSTFLVTVERCDQENVVTDNSSVCCQSSAATATAAAAADDDDAGVADNNVLLSCNKAVSPECKPVEEKSGSYGNHPCIELAVVASAAVTAMEEIACADGDKELGSCQSVADDSENSQQSGSQTAESVCLELSEMMRESCVIGDHIGKPVVSETSANGVVSNDDAGKLILNGITSSFINDAAQVLDGTTMGDADISDSFDLDVATKDLESRVSAGMLDFLLDSYEDSDEDVSSEQLDQELDECSLSDGDDDDDDDDDGSESTLAESSSGDSVVVVVDDDDDDDDDDEDVLKRHERIKRCMKNSSNCDNNSTNNVGSSIGNLTMLSHDDDNDEEDVLKRLDRIKRCVANICNCDNNVHSAANVNPSAVVISEMLCDDGDNFDGGHNIDIKYVNDDAAVKPCGGVGMYLNSGDHDDAKCATDADISTVDIICAAADDDSDDDDDDDDVLTRHERVKQLLKNAAAAAADDDDDDDNCKAKDSDLVAAGINRGCMGDDNPSSLNQRCPVTADDVCDSSTADNCATGDNCAGETHLAITRDRVSISEKCVHVQNNDEQLVEQSLSCRNVDTTSPVVEFSQHHVLSKPDMLTSSTCIAKSPVSATVCSPCTQPPSDIQNTDSCRYFSANTSLSADDLAAGSTPSTCSHHSQTHCSLIQWREGIYDGLCQHSDGSQIRMSCIASY